MECFHVNINIYIELTSVFFLLILLVFTFLQYGNATKHGAAFRSYLTTLLLATSYDVFGMVILNINLGLPYYLAVLISGSVYLMKCLPPYFFIKYIAAYTDWPKKHLDTVHWIFDWTLVLYGIVLVLMASRAFLLKMTQPADEIMGGMMVFYLGLTVELALGLVAMLVFFPVCRKFTYLHVSSYTILFLITLSYCIYRFCFPQTVPLGLTVISIGTYILFFAMESRDYHSVIDMMGYVRQAGEEAEYSAREWEMFIRRMSENIRKPLYALGEDAGELELKAKNEETRSYARSISASQETLDYLVRDIFDMVHARSDSLQLFVLRFHLSEVLCDIRSMMTVMAEAKGLQFIIHESDGIPDIWYGDSIRLRQILINLIANGVKYTSNGYVALEISLTTDGRLCLAVSDTGIGIRKKDIPHLFDKFARMDGQKNAHIQGTGLGLAVVSELVHKMDGKIEVNSVYGQGSTFTVILPLRSGLEMKDDGNILDTKLGLAYCGDSMELYIRVLRLTVHYADEKRRLLAEAFGKDQELYLRLIYSMKSNALNVGAKKLSDAAAEMQKLANRMQKEDTDPYLVSRHQNMLEVFDETIYRSKRLLNDYGRNEGNE